MKLDQDSHIAICTKCKPYENNLYAPYCNKQFILGAILPIYDRKPDRNAVCVAIMCLNLFIGKKSAVTDLDRVSNLFLLQE